MMPAPAPLDSVLHYPPLGTVTAGVVSIPLRDSRAERTASKIKGSSKDAKIKPLRTEVPARKKSTTPPPQRAVPPQLAVSGSEILGNALSGDE